MIKFDNVSKKYNNLQVLNNIDFKINEGEIFGVIGESGAGKSTLIRTINKIENIDNGSITVGSIDVTTCSSNELKKLRQDIGFVFQNFNLLTSLNVYDNISLPLKKAKYKKDEIKNRVDELLKLVNLEDQQHKFIHQLSGGQKQRVGIARALSLNPKILLCDEATSALDPNTTSSILDLLVEINNKLNITIVVITHEMEVIKEICDRVVVLDKGNIVDFGTVLDVFSSPKSSETKQLLSTIFNKPQIEENHNLTVTINYVGDVNEHGVSSLCRTLNIDFNIIDGQVLSTKQGKYGKLTVEFDEKQDEVLNYLTENNFNFEVIS